VAFTDDDCTPTPGWLQGGLDACRSEPGAIVQGRTDPRPDQLHLISPFSRTMVIHAVGPLYETCNIFYPRELLEELGGFAGDTYALPAGEDTDLAWRALERGVSTRYEPSALVHHEVLVAGPVGMLRNAIRWHTAIPVFARHPALRREHLHRGIFWSNTHEHLLRFLLGLAVARRSRLLALVLARPYLIRLVRRRSGPLLAPYILLVDIVELAAVLRGSWRSRVLVV
jgi:GT2 family glycosyltransferase